MSLPLPLIPSIFESAIRLPAIPAIQHSPKPLLLWSNLTKSYYISFSPTTVCQLLVTNLRHSLLFSNASTSTLSLFKLFNLLKSPLTIYLPPNTLNLFYRSQQFTYLPRLHQNNRNPPGFSISHSRLALYVFVFSTRKYPAGKFSTK